MKNLKIIIKEDLTILEISKKGTLILNCDDYKLFGFENRPFNLSAVPIVNGHTKKIIYEVKGAYKHTWSQSQQNMSEMGTFKIIDIKSIKDELSLTDDDLAKMFGYKNRLSYTNSSAKSRIEKGLVSFYSLIKKSEGEI
ncbi:MAG: hypothetical protein WC389_00155 [Lutibacter sp.]|jgi:hypothetical protein